MKATSFAVKASLIASMLITGQSFAQSLPDEINHTHYLSVYKNLEQVLNQKKAEYEKLSQEKQEIENTIAMMEKDSVEIPARNAELNRIIESKRQDIARINSEIQGLEGVLGKLIEDLRRIDSMISQLQRDINDESNRSLQIQQQRNQMAQEVAKLNARLQREINEENQSAQLLNKMTKELDSNLVRRQEVDRDRINLIRDVDRFKLDLPKVRSDLTQNTNLLNSRRPQLTDAQSKLPAIKSEISAEEAKLSNIDVSLNPKKALLAALKTELARVSPDIARLNSENKTLEQKIAANETKINAANITGLKAKLNTLNNEVAALKSQIDANTKAQTAIQEKIRPVTSEIAALHDKMREATRLGNRAEAARLKSQIDSLNNSLAGDQREIQRLSKASELLMLSIAPKQMEINNLTSQITTAEASVSSLVAENNRLQGQINQNNKKIAEITQANSGLAQQIAEAEGEVKALEAQRGPIAQKILNLRQQETKLNTQITTLSSDIKRLENELKTLSARLTQMETAINTFPQEKRRLELHIQQLDQKNNELRSQIDREQRLLARIRQDRTTIQNDAHRAQNVLNQINQDLSNSQVLVGNLRGRLNEETNNREALTRYNQDSIRKLDNLKIQKASNEKEISNASEEIGINNQDISTIAQELPKLRADLSTLRPKVTAAESSRNTAQVNADNANTQYQNRLSLYQNYLTQAHSLGSEKASIGSSDGARAGAVDAKAKAQKIAAESASAEAKWEALRRGYVRGEIAGFRAGFDIGMSSSPDALKGEEEGRLAGARRAKDHSNLVVKPEIYLEELERRLREDVTTPKELVSLMVRQEVQSIKSMAAHMAQTVDDLSMEEINEAAQIITSLDRLIAEAEVEVEEVLELRKKLTEAASVYSAPATGANLNNANCSEVYKGVKEFIEACKGSYVIRYQSLYNASHSETFKREYKTAFNQQIQNVFAAELNKLYPGYLKEATNVGREVGVATGKKEIYQQTFKRSEDAAYASSLPGEIARVETEAANLVQDHLNQNAALTLKGSAKLVANDKFGISPGADLDVKMLIKNIGSQASTGNSIIRVTEISSNLSTDRKEAPLGTVAPESHTELNVLKVKVSDVSLPGSKVVLAGEIIHPGNHYKSSRTENFRIETVLGINPSVTSSVDMDKTPNISNLFGTKKHDIDLVIKPQFSGVDQGYEATLEEIGSDFVDITARPAKTEVLKRGAQKKLRFTYKLSKASKGKTVTLRLTVKNDGLIVTQEDIQIKPE